MTWEAIRGALEIRPFRPITIHTTSGSSHLVTRRESIWQPPEGGTIVISTGGESFVMIAIDPITSLHINWSPTSET